MASVSVSDIVTTGFFFSLVFFSIFQAFLATFMLSLHYYFYFLVVSCTLFIVEYAEKFCSSFVHAVPVCSGFPYLIFSSYPIPTYTLSNPVWPGLVALSFTCNIWKFSKCAPTCHISNYYGLPCSSWRIITIMNWQPVRALSTGTEMAQRDFELRRQQTAGSSMSDVFTENKGCSYFRGQASDHLFTLWNSLLILLKQKGNTRYVQLQGAIDLYDLCTWQKSKTNIYSNSHFSIRSFFTSRNSL